MDNKMKITREVYVLEKDWNKETISKTINQVINEYLIEKLNNEGLPNTFKIEFYYDENFPFSNGEFKVFVIYNDEEFFIKKEIPEDISEYQRATAKVVVNKMENGE